MVCENPFSCILHYWGEKYISCTYVMFGNENEEPYPVGVYVEEAYLEEVAEDESLAFKLIHKVFEDFEKYNKLFFAFDDELMNAIEKELKDGNKPSNKAINTELEKRCREICNEKMALWDGRNIT